MAEAAHKGTTAPAELADENDVLDYLRSVPSLRDRLGDPRNVTCRTMGTDGLNRTFGVWADGHGVAVVKQALSSIHVKGEEWPLEHRHSIFERRALELHDSICPGMVPEVYHSDAARGILVLQHLGEIKNLADHWKDGAKDLPSPDAVARFCAQVMFRTSDYFLSTEQKMILVEFFAPNMELAGLSDRRLFLYPYVNEPCAETTEEARLAACVSMLRRERMTRQECLCHGRLGARAIVTRGDAVHVLSPSYACWGPLGFDAGTVCGQMVALALRYVADGVELCVGWINAFWERLESEFRSLWRQENHGEGTPADFFECLGGEEALETFRTTVVQDMLAQMAGFAGCELIATARECSPEQGCEVQYRVGRELVLCHRDVHAVQDLGIIVMEQSHRI